MDGLMLRLALQDLQDRYVAAIDNDRLEEWPGFFIEACHYGIVSRENEEAGLPAPVIHCTSAAMLRDRVLALRHANIYEKPAYRHALSGMVFRTEPDGSHAVETSYIVVNTDQEGVSHLYQAGRYLDQVVMTEAGLRFRSKRCIYDTLRVQTLLAYPI